MIDLEKMYEMMNPTKAFEAVTQGKFFDVEAQSKLVESTTDQVVGLMDACQTQTRKAVEFWMDQSDVAMTEAKKLVKEWAASLTKANSQLVSEVEATVKDAAKVLELPPKSAKASKKA